MLFADAGRYPGMKDTRIILHVDMDSFYSSVEVRENPSLRGLPVVVGSDPMSGNGRGVVSTCSYEAREFGLHSGMAISKAYELCPDAVYLKVNKSLYKEVSGKIMPILRKHCTGFEQVSVDEAYLDVTDMVKSFDEASELGLKIKEEVRAREGITCSIGIAPCMSVAKIASDIDKPDGITVVRPGDVQEFLYRFNASRLPGIGKKSSQVLESMGIVTVKQLAQTNVQVLIGKFGKAGLMMHQMANGIDPRKVVDRGEVQSISKEDTFDVDTGDMEFIERVIAGLAEDVHRSLLKKRLLFRSVTIKVRFSDFTTYTRVKSLGANSSELGHIIRTARGLLHEFEGRGKFRLVGVGVSRLIRIDECQTRITDFL